MDHKFESHLGSQKQVSNRLRIPVNSPRPRISAQSVSLALRRSAVLLTARAAGTSAPPPLGARWRVEQKRLGDLREHRHRLPHRGADVGGNWRARYVVVDDPHSVDQAESEGKRSSAIEWWNGSMSTRLNDFATGHQIVIQQRLHEADLTGDLLQRGAYELLCLRLNCLTFRNSGGPTEEASRVATQSHG
jgi:hypothetical protein